MKPMLMLCLLLLSCAPPDTDTSATSGLTSASADYLVLAQRTLLGQAETDTLLLADLLTPGVCFASPDTGTDWQGWQQRQGIRSMRLHGLTSLPVQTQQPLALSGQAGVHVVCYARADTRYHDGRSGPLLWHACYHFDACKRIDYGRPPNPFANLPIPYTKPYETNALLFSATVPTRVGDGADHSLCETNAQRQWVGQQLGQRQQ